MATEESLTVSKVRPGAVLLQDVFSVNQKRLFKAGHRLTPDDIKTLKLSGVQEIVIADESSADSQHEVISQRQSGSSRAGLSLDDAFQPGAVDREAADSVERKYSADAVQQSQKCLNDASETLERIVHRMTCNLAVPAASLAASWQEFLQVARLDSGVALFTLAERNVDLKNQPASQVIISQSIMRAGLASVIAIESGLDSSTCASIATAAMVHDISLLEEMRPVVERMVNSRLTTSILHREHSVFSSQLFSNMDGVSDSMANMIREVHEQVDGSGFPFGLRAEQISFGGRILNVVDSYVRMISDPQDDPYFPADVLAHLVYHTKEGAFDREVVCHLLTATSMYPVGSPVELNNDSDAIVYRSNGFDFTHPVVMQKTAQEDIVFDLRNLGQYITKPLQDNRQQRSRRIRMSSMHNRLWMEGVLV